MENNEKEGGKKTKQQITIPFLWEVKPGEPKEDWQTTPRLDESLTSVFQPVKYVASVPFIWEEQPGIPLKCFTPETLEHSSLETKEHSSGLETLPQKSCLLPLPPAYFTMLGSESDEESSYDFHDWISEDFEAVSVKSEESFTFDPLLLQDNHLAPSKVTDLTVSTVAPLQNPSLMQQKEECSEGSSSPEDSSSPRSCASRNASLRGAAFLEYMFPLYPPKTAFLDRPGNYSVKKGDIQYNTELTLPSLEEYKKHDTEFRRKRPLTLVELIEQRRKKSYHKKAVQMKAKNSPKDFDEEKPYGCFNFGANGARLTKMLERWDALLDI